MPRASFTPIDQHIGRRLRARRQDLSLTLFTLADRVGIAAQQVQKYETGRNRISASRLFDLAEVLGVPVSWFFHGVATVSDEEDHDTVALFAATPEGAEVAELWPGLSPHRRQELLQLVRTMTWAPR